MSCIQINACQPCCYYTRIFCSRTSSLALCAAPAQILQPRKASMTLTAYSSSYLGSGIPKISLKLATGASGLKQSMPVCLSGGEGKSGNDYELSSPWKALEKAMGNLKKDQSIEDVLRKQIQKQDYYDDGGNDGNPPAGGGGGGGNGFGESEDESMSGMLDELVQVILATMGIVFLYMYIIEAEEITTFAKDIIKFIFTRQKSIRLTRLIDSWTRFFREMTVAKDPDPYWLQREIVNTTTLWDSPTKYRHILRDYMSSRSY